MTLSEFLDLAPNQCLAPAWFAHRFAAELPRGLRERAGALTWERFVATYAPAGPVRLGSWECTDDGRRRGPHQAGRFRAVLAVGDRIGTSTAAATGPIAALGAMLHERGMPVEILNFHQLRAGGHTATFVRGGDGARDEWAAGFADDPTESALRAVIACANRLIG